VVAGIDSSRRRRTSQVSRVLWYFL